MGTRQLASQPGRVLGWFESGTVSPLNWPSKYETHASCIYQGGDKYQQAFYVFEELAQAPSTSSIVSLVSQAVSELHLGRTEEATAALEQAIQKEPKYSEAIANMVVLSVITGKNPKEYIEYITPPPPPPP